MLVNSRRCRLTNPAHAGKGLVRAWPSKSPIWPHLARPELPRMKRPVAGFLVFERWVDNVFICSGRIWSKRTAHNKEEPGEPGSPLEPPLTALPVSPRLDAARAAETRIGLRRTDFRAHVEAGGFIIVFRAGTLAAGMVTFRIVHTMKRRE